MMLARGSHFRWTLHPGSQALITRGAKRLARGGPNESDELAPRSHSLGWWGSKGPGRPGYPRTTPLRQAGLDLNLQERLDEMYAEEKHQRQQRRDIGFPRQRKETPLNNRSQMLEYVKKLRADKAMEKAARERTLKVDLEAVKREAILTGSIFDATFEAAEYYGIFDDIFHSAVFTPSLFLNVKFDYDENLVTPVYQGNIVKPREAEKAPQVSFESDPESLWTLILTNPDGHFTDENSEYLHWMVSNIKGGDLRSGQTICGYLQPFPPFGIGYQRFIFVLYKQNGQLDLSEYKPTTEDQIILKERTFQNREFFTKFEDQITPAGLAFFQSDYDTSLTSFFHNTLNMKEPRYEYHFVQTYIRPWSSMRKHKEGFNLFLDKYRDPKEIEEEVVRNKIRSFHPFKGDLDKRWKYPNVHPIDFHLPEWRRREIERERLHQGVFQHKDWSPLRRDPTLA